ncbi:MAG TPA: 3-deoxy-8-phosphooctulonate synthase [Firmicutes bacterium]|nr:3-deoxy-8-phosphooctulonate synthase [Bacillota bacterium]
MAATEFTMDHGAVVSNAAPLTLIAGPCVIESREMSIEVAGRMAELCASLGVNYVFKSSYDKANRSSVTSFRGPGMEAGLEILAEVKGQTGVPVLTDVHTERQAAEAAEVVDVLQIPAFLCRQTDLLVAAARTGRVVNVKKGQFMAPWDMANVLNKLSEGGCERVLVTERGATFGYNNLVVDFRGMLYFRDQGWPCCFDATHSVQLPGGAGTMSSGQRQYVAGLSTAAVSLGIAALFWEVHPDPDSAKCDGPNQLRLADVPALLSRIADLDKWAKG